MYAAQYGSTELNKALLVRNASVDIQKEHGFAALMYAAQYDSTELGKVCFKAELADGLGRRVQLW